MVLQGNLVIPSNFAVIPLLRGNSDALNQSNLRNFPAYIINVVIPIVIPPFHLISYAQRGAGHCGTGLHETKWRLTQTVLQYSLNF